MSFLAKRPSYQAPAVCKDLFNCGLRSWVVIQKITRYWKNKQHFVFIERHQMRITKTHVGWQKSPLVSGHRSCIDKILCRHSSKIVNSSLSDQGQS
jgi:hypothetical protein